MDVASAFKAASDSIEGKKGSGGINDIGALIDKLNEVKEASSTANMDGIGQAKQSVEAFQSTLDKALGDPASLAPSGGCAAGCAGWYGGRVAKKLGCLKGEAKTLGLTFEELMGEVSGAMSQLPTTMGSVVPTISGQVQRLLALPSDLADLANKLESAPADQRMDVLAGIDLSPVETALDVSPVNASLDDLAAIAASLAPLTKKVADAVQSLSTFKTKMPSKVRRAFDIAPCVPVASVAPPAMKSLLESLKCLDSLDLNPLVKALVQTSETLKGFDAEKIRSPVTAFATAVKEDVEPLVDMLTQAKQAGQLGQSFQQAFKSLSKLW